jgi:hypothetical protein
MNDQPRKATRKARPTESRHPTIATPDTNAARASVRVAAHSLLDRLTVFHEQLQAMTIEGQAGWRIVAGRSGAVALTESRLEVLKRMNGLEEAMIAAHGRQVDPAATPLRFMESDSPDGPWTPIPASSVTARTYGIGGGGADAMLCDALEGLGESIAFPSKRNPSGVGVRQDTFNQHDELWPMGLTRMESALKALRLWCGRSPVGAGLQSVPQSASAAPEGVAESESESDAASITFTAKERKKLKTMASRDGAFLWSASALGDHAGFGDETARRFIARLCDHDLAERPEGNRRGARLTTRGQALARKLSEPQD